MERSFSEVVDCSRCTGWCCRVYAFDAGAGFGHAKAAGESCRHLTVLGRCGVYTQRQHCGYTGCVGYTCYGAGPRLSEVRPEPSRGLELEYFALRELCEWGWVTEQLVAASATRSPGPSAELARLVGLRERLLQRVFGATTWTLAEARAEAQAVAGEVRAIARALPEVVNTAAELLGAARRVQLSERGRSDA